MPPVRLKATYGHRPRLPGRNASSLVLAAGMAARSYRLHRGTAWALVLFHKDLQDRDALGWESLLPAKSLVSWAEGWLWAVLTSGQAVLTREQGYSGRRFLHATGCLLLTFPSPLPPLHGCFYALPWIRQKSGGEFLYFRGAEQN